MRKLERLFLVLILLALPLASSAEELRILARDVPLDEIPKPYNWGHAKAYNLATPLDFHVDLDLLAPLGKGETNAALFFKDFAVTEERAKELGRTLDGVRYEDAGVGYGFDDPFVLESEQWIESSTMSFYPEIWKLEGIEDIRIPNLLFFMKLGKTWLAKGNRAESPAEALDEYRRIVKLGRLVLQDDVTVIQDLIGIALVRMGAEAIYDLARTQNDAKAMLVASLVIQDVHGIRNQTRYRLKDLYWGNENDETPLLSFKRWFGNEIEQEEYEHANDVASMSGDRRLRLEGVESLGFILKTGESSFSSKARERLGVIAREDPDPLVRQLAKWHLDRSES